MKSIIAAVLMFLVFGCASYPPYRNSLRPSYNPKELERIKKEIDRRTPLLHKKAFNYRDYNSFKYTKMIRITRSFRILKPL